MTEQDIENWYNSGRMPYRFDMDEFEAMIKRIEARAVREANQSIVDNIDMPDTWMYVDYLTDYANRLENQ